MGINLNPFTWWNGASWGTMVGLLGKTRVGEDAAGNVYYEGGKDTAGRPRRWVIYNGYSEASTIPPGWHGWMHYRTDVPPSQESYVAREWQKPHQPNLTGTPNAYRPSGSTLSTGKRPKATGDYQPWTPVN